MTTSEGNVVRKTKRAASKTAGSTPSKPKGWTLAMPSDPEGATHDQLMAHVATDGIVGNARSLVAFGHGTFGELSLTDCAKVLKNTAQVFNDGDLSAAVTMLSSQAVALNAMFGELARRSALNMGEYLDASERYMRLALKSQGQCRATLETLAAIKNPPVVFARQANINNGGQQQVNNGTLPQSADQYANAREASGPSNPRAHLGETVSGPNELLEDRTHGSPTMDTRATAAAGRANPSLEPVAKINRPAHP